MKRAIVVLSFLLINSLILAQTPLSSGTFTIGGSVSFSSQSFEKKSNNLIVFTADPHLGYFFFDNFYSAVTFSYGHYAVGNFSDEQFGFGPAVRYYFGTEKIKPFLGLGFNYYNQTNNFGKNKFTLTEIKPNGGIDYFITTNFALEASVNYSILNYSSPSDFYSDGTGHSRLFQLAVGVNYFIN